jgi:hypothetical protein
VTGSVPAAGWEVALERFATLAAATSADWMLVGSAASAVHGVGLQPGDIDVLARSAADVSTLASVLPPAEAGASDPHLDPETFLSTAHEPVATFEDGTWTFGRWLLEGVRVEVAHIAADDGRLHETTGSAVWRHRQTAAWRGIRLPIVPLEVQLATMLGRGLTDRARAAAARLHERGHDPGLLRRALEDQGVDLSHADIGG